jgi:hypothetical protein
MAAGTVTGQILTSPKILIGGYDVTGYHNKISAPITMKEMDAQAFGRTGKMRLAGQTDLVMTHSGFWEGGATSIDAILRGVNTSNVLSLCPQSGAEGEQGWFTNVINLKYETMGKVGDLNPFTGAAYASGDNILNGKIMKSATITASGTGTAYNLGAASESQYLYAVLHVTATSGDANRTLDVIIESGDDANMAAATTRLTFTQVTTGVTAEFLTPVAGIALNTQAFWRASYTRGGTTGSFTMYVLFAIL